MSPLKESPLQEITDENAVARACAGDSEAFSFLYERNVTRIYNYIYYRIGSDADAEDITSRVFYRAFGHINTYVEKGVPFSAWLYRIAHNLIANWHRDTHRRKEVPLEDQIELPVKADHPERAMEKTQEVEQLLQGIRRLSPDRQQLLILKFVEDFSNAEIANIMGKSEGAIKSLYHRALIALRVEMDKIGFQERE
ncbi:MAG: sigma-70 family RNA polymerase sigma factor [Anaerolineaceae bacterium]|nr:sigma-70 family RNA polymerase sigma factor [Anaerolineaceae bacterium]